MEGETDKKTEEVKEKEKPRLKGRRLLVSKENRLRRRIVNRLNSGCYFVSAPPGCGKTRLLAERVVNHMVTNPPLKKEGDKGPQERLLCLTFTRNAAEEMKEQIKKVAESSKIAAEEKERIATAVDKGENIVVSDLHALAYKIILQNRADEHGINNLRLNTEGNDAVFDNFFKKPAPKNVLWAKGKGKRNWRKKESPMPELPGTNSLYIDGVNFLRDKYKNLAFRLSNFMRAFDRCASANIYGIDHDGIIDSVSAFEKAGVSLDKFRRKNRKFDICSCLVYEYDALASEIDKTRKLLQLQYPDNKKVDSAIEVLPKCAQLIYLDKKKRSWIDHSDSLIELYFFLDEATRADDEARKNRLELLEKIGFDWIEVDEVQDNSLLQLLIIDLLRRPQKADPKENDQEAEGKEATIDRKTKKRDYYKKVPVVYFGDAEQNIYSSMSDTKQALNYVRHRIGRSSHKLQLRGNFRSEKDLLNYFNKYSQQFFQTGDEDKNIKTFPMEKTLTDRKEKPDNFCDNPEGQKRVRHISVTKRSGQDKAILDDILNRHVTNSKLDRVSGNTVVLFRKNDDVQSFYSEAIKYISSKDNGQSPSDVFMFGKTNHIFTDKDFAAVKTLLLTAAGIYDPSWTALLSHPHFEKSRAIGKLKEDRQLKKTRQTPDLFLEMNPDKSYLMDWYYHLRNNWGVAIREERYPLMMLVSISACRDSNNDIVLTLHPGVVNFSSDGGDDYGLRRSRATVGIQEIPQIITISAGTGKGIEKLGNYSKTFVAENAQELLCSINDTPALLEALKKNRIWDPVRIHSIMTNGDAYPRKAAASTLMLDMFYRMTNFNQDGGIKNLDKGHETFFKNKLDTRNQARIEVCRFFGETYARVLELLGGKDIGTASPFASVETDEGYLIERALRILCNEFIEKDSPSRGCIAPVLTFCRRLCGELVKKNPAARNNLSLQVRLLQQELFGCTVSRLFKEGCIQSRIITMTVHKAKGMTFDHVVVADCVKGSYPRIQRTGYNEEEEMEDKRLMYVAITRGRYSLTFFSYEQKDTNGSRVRVKKSPYVLVKATAISPDKEKGGKKTRPTASSQKRKGKKKSAQSKQAASGPESKALASEPPKDSK